MIQNHLCSLLSSAIKNHPFSLQSPGVRKAGWGEGTEGGGYQPAFNQAPWLDETSKVKQSLDVQNNRRVNLTTSYVEPSIR